MLTEGIIEAWIRFVGLNSENILTGNHLFIFVTGMILYMFISTNISFQSKDIIKIKLGNLKLHVIQDWVWEGQQGHLSQVFFLVLV